MNYVDFLWCEYIWCIKQYLRIGSKSYLTRALIMREKIKAYEEQKTGLYDIKAA